MLQQKGDCILGEEAEFSKLAPQRGEKYLEKEDYVLSLSTHTHPREVRLSPPDLCLICETVETASTYLLHLFPKTESNCYFVPLRKGGLRGSLNECLSNFGMYQNHLDCCPTPRISDSVDQRWA